MEQSKACGIIVILLSTVYSSLCAVVNVSPDGDQTLPINSPLNITLACNVSEDSSNSVQTQAIWEVAGRQIQSGDNAIRMAFENIGIFIEEEAEAMGVVNLIVSRGARMQYQETGLMVTCTAFTAGEPPITLKGRTITIRTYGRPEAPGNLGLVASKPTMLVWERPTNIPAQVEVNYTVNMESATTNLGETISLSGETQFSIERLETRLRDSEMCHPFTFSVVAQVADTNDSIPAVVMDTVPLSSDVSSIEGTLKVDSVMLSNDDIVARVSFKAIESCSQNFPVRNYTLIVDGSSVGSTIAPMPADGVLTGTITSANLPVLVPDTMFQVGVQACSDVVCRTSAITIPLNTTDVQTARVVFFENNVFLTCSLAGGSVARGCTFTFRVNRNATGNELFSVLQSEGGRQCNTTVNQQNGYMDISVLDLEVDGRFGQLPLAVDAVLVDSQDEYFEMTGCSVEGAVTDNRAVSIAVSIVVVLLLLAMLTMVIMGLLYYRLRKRKTPKFVETEYPDTLLLEIKSDNQKILKNSPLTRRSPLSALQSLPVTSQRMDIRATASLPHFHGEQAPLSFSVPPERAAPIEVELDRDTVKVSLNKSALRAMARFQYMAKRHAEATATATEGSLTSEEALSLLPTTNFSRVHLTEEFKSLCCELPPLEEGGEEEKEMRSWCVINTPPLSPEIKHQDTVM